MQVPTPTEFRKGYLAFQKHEARDAMYKTATFLVNHFWGRSTETADGLGVLLLTWNQALYRYGLFDFGALEQCISRNSESLSEFRPRVIFDHSASDDDEIRRLFEAFLAALTINSGSKMGSRSPVATAKALHLLAPEYFPLWDEKIAKAYDCYYARNPADGYLEFFGITKRFAEKLRATIDHKATGKTLVKLIDEYNYARYTRKWV